MSPNGVTHWEVADDYAGCDSIVQWLDFMPEQFPGAAAPDVPVPVCPPSPPRASGTPWGLVGVGTRTVCSKSEKLKRKHIGQLPM